MNVLGSRLSYAQVLYKAIMAHVPALGIRSFVSVLVFFVFVKMHVSDMYTTCLPTITVDQQLYNDKSASPLL